MPANVADVLEPEVPALTAELLAAIGREVPEYRRPLEGSFGRGVRIGVNEALRQFLELIRDPDVDRESGRGVYSGLGRGELRHGRSLDALLSAYRVGARVAWRRFAAAGTKADLAQPVINLLAESIFAYIDEISAASAAGYAAEQSAREGARERERRHLLALLVTDSPDPAELEALSAGAGWAVPATVAALASDRAELGRIARHLPIECVASSVGGVGCIAVPDPDGPGRRALLKQALAGCPGALGPTVPVDRFAASWREAAAAYGALKPEGLVLSEEHLFAMLLAENRPRLRRIASRRLAALQSLTPKARARMIETLAASLAGGGEVAAIAAELHLHPQTVRYRLRRLSELLGEQLDDPAARLELHAALGAGVLAPASAETP